MIETRGGGATVDAGAMAARLDALAAIGAAGDGVSRLGFSAEERRAHELVASWLEAAGMTVTVDAVGNTIGERPGTRGGPAIGTGSHLDSVERGGRFDGAAGVVAGVEVAHLLARSDVPLSHPFRVVAFAAEEGARFGEPCLGSKAVAGALDAARLARLADRAGTSAYDAAAASGLRPDRLDDCRWHPRDWGAFVELHVEQGAVLDAALLEVGFVDVVSGSTRVAITLDGEAAHSGTTPMRARADALAAAAEVVLEAERVATSNAYRGARATIGRLDVEPNGITTVAGRARLVLDLRDIDPVRQRQGAREVLDRAERACRARGVRLRHEVIADSPPTFLPGWLRRVLYESCEAVGATRLCMTSGASHDAQVVNRIVPSALLFVPSRGGVSHSPDEWTAPEALARGVEVLHDCMRRLDGLLPTPAGEDAA